MILILLISLPIIIVFGFLYSMNFNHWQDRLKAWKGRVNRRVQEGREWIDFQWWRLKVWWQDKLFRIMYNIHRFFLNRAHYHAQFYYRLIERMEFCESLESETIIKLPEDGSNEAV